MNKNKLFLLLVFTSTAISAYNVFLHVETENKYNEEITNLKNKIEMIKNEKEKSYPLDATFNSISIDAPKYMNKIKIDGSGIHMDSGNDDLEINSFSIKIFDSMMKTSSTLNSSILEMKNNSTGGSAFFSPWVISISKPNGDNDSIISSLGQVYDLGETSLGLSTYHFEPGDKGKIKYGTWVTPTGIRISDAEGKNRAVLGSSELVTTTTGATETTAPSSLTLFDKQGHLILRLPSY